MKKAIKKSQNSIKYTGNVKVSVQKDNKIISSKTYHNSGTLYLFKFLCYCLAGRYDTIKNDRPLRIKLFNNPAPTPAEAPTSAPNNALSAFITIDQNPEIIPMRENPEDLSEVTNYKTVLHFLIPYSFIVNGDRKINQILLYSAKAENDNYSAYYYFTNESGEAWEGLDINVTNPDAYNLIIEWELLFN